MKIACLVYEMYTYILTKVLTSHLLFTDFLPNQKQSRSSIYISRITHVSVILNIKKFNKILSFTSRMRRWTQIPPFLKFTKFSIVSQLANPLYYCGIWLKEQRNAEINTLPVWQWLFGVKKLKHTPPLNAKSCLFWKSGYLFSSVTPERNILTCAKLFSKMVYWHIRLSGAINGIAGLLWRKMMKTKWPVKLLDSIYHRGVGTTEHFRNISWRQSAGVIAKHGFRWIGNITNNMSHGSTCIW